MLKFQQFELSHINMFNLLQSSSYTSLSNRHTTFINKEIDALHSRREALTRKIREIQNSKNSIANLKQELQNQKDQLYTSSSQMKNVEIKLQKYKLKKIDLQNRRVAEIIEYQQLQLQLQSLKKQLLQVFTPKSNQLQALRLQLIQIESDSQIMKISKQFSIRKMVLLFMKKNKIEIQDNQIFELQISKRNLIEQFRKFIQEQLTSKKLNQFGQVFREPLQKYIQILYQIKEIQRHPQNIIKSQDLKSQEQKQQSLIVEWNTKKHELMTKKNQIDKIEYKISQNHKKIVKYEQEVKQSRVQHEEFQSKVKYFAQVKQTQKQQEKILIKLKTQMRQLDEALDYLSQKRNLQNSNFLNSPKSLGYIDSLEHSKVQKTAILQNCQLSHSHMMSRSTKYSDASLLRSPKNRLLKDNSSSKFRKLVSPSFR